MRVEYVPGSPRVPDYMGTLEGWRLWIAQRHEIRWVDGSGNKTKTRGPYLLRSIVSNELWRPRRPMVADCEQTPGYLFDLTHDDGDGTSPDSACKCGIYAVRSLRKLLEMYEGTSRAYFRFDMERHAAVVGRVKLWGKVIPAKWGWRAQYAYPSKLFVVDTLVGRMLDRHRRVRADLENYGIPIASIAPDDLLSHAASTRSKMDDRVIDLTALEP